MNSDYEWDKFKKSGNILDYLSYKSKSEPLAPNEPINKEFMPAENTDRGVSREDRCKWNSYPRSGLW